MQHQHVDQAAVNKQAEVMRCEARHCKEHMPQRASFGSSQNAEHFKLSPGVKGVIGKRIM